MDGRRAGEPLSVSEHHFQATSDFRAGAVKDEI
jgi:hypothetical protein